MNTRAAPLELRRGLCEAQRLEAARLYLAAFERKLAPVFGAAARAIPVIAVALELERCLAAVQGGRLVGIVGLNFASTAFPMFVESLPTNMASNTSGNEQRFLNLTGANLVHHYGFWRGWLNALLLVTLERRVTAGQLLLDGVAVAPEWRGAGIGTRLLREAEVVALEQGLKSVRLDVVDTNPSAERLYRRLGYTETGRTRLPWPLTLLWGFSHSTAMVKPLP